MSRARILLQDEGTIQVNRASEAVHLRDATVARTTVIPPVETGDITLTLSTAHTATTTDEAWVNDSYTFLVDTDRLLNLAVGGSGFHGRVSFVRRQGDAFIFDYGSQGSTAGRLVTGRPKEVFGQAANGTFWYHRGFNFAQLDDVIVMHNTAVPGGATTETWDEFNALRYDTTSLTAYWEDTQRPLEPSSIIPSSTMSLNTSEHRRMTKLDGSTVLVGGATALAGGFLGQLWMVQYDSGATPTGEFTAYGPFDFGSKSAEGDAHTSNGTTMLVRLDATRVLVLWTSYAEPDLSVTTTLRSSRPLFAQVFDYNTTSHTMVAGEQYVFESGLEGVSDMQAHWYEDAGVLVLASINFDNINLYGDSSTSFTAWDYNLTARTLRISGSEVTEGTSRHRIATISTQVDATDYWYGFQMVGAGDRLAFLWPNGGSTSMDIMYTKVRVGLVGNQRGALGAYDEGVLIADAGTSGELYQHNAMIGLDATSNLALFEQYEDDYATYRYLFLMAEEGP